MLISAFVIGILQADKPVMGGSFTFGNQTFSKSKSLSSSAADTSQPPAAVPSEATPGVIPSATTSSAADTSQPPAAVPSEATPGVIPSATTSSAADTSQPPAEAPIPSATTSPAASSVTTPTDMDQNSTAQASPSSESPAASAPKENPTKITIDHQKKIINIDTSTGDSQKNCLAVCSAASCSKNQDTFYKCFTTCNKDNIKGCLLSGKDKWIKNSKNVITCPAFDSGLLPKIDELSKYLSQDTRKYPNFAKCSNAYNIVDPDGKTLSTRYNHDKAMLAYFVMEDAITIINRAKAFSIKEDDSDITKNEKEKFLTDLENSKDQLSFVTSTIESIDGYNEKIKTIFKEPIFKTDSILLKAQKFWFLYINSINNEKEQINSINNEKELLAAKEKEQIKSTIDLLSLHYDFAFLNTAARSWYFLNANKDLQEQVLGYVNDISTMKNIADSMIELVNYYRNQIKNMIIREGFPADMPGRSIENWIANCEAKNPDKKDAKNFFPAAKKFGFSDDLLEQMVAAGQMIYAGNLGKLILEIFKDPKNIQKRDTLKKNDENNYNNVIKNLAKPDDSKPDDSKPDDSKPDDSLIKNMNMLGLAWLPINNVILKSFDGIENNYFNKILGYINTLGSKASNYKMSDSECQQYCNNCDKEGINFAICNEHCSKTKYFSACKNQSLNNGQAPVAKPAS